MAITRAQQAKQMLQDGGMLVKPRADGKRPGYYGPDAGHENDPGHGSNAPGGDDPGERGRQSRVEAQLRADRKRAAALGDPDPEIDVPVGRRKDTITKFSNNLRANLRANPFSMLTPLGTLVKTSFQTNQAQQMMGLPGFSAQFDDPTRGDEKGEIPLWMQLGYNSEAEYNAAMSGGATTPATTSEPAVDINRVAYRLMADGGAVIDDEPRQAYGLGSIVKKATRAIKKVAKSDLGKLAIIAAGGYALGGGFSAAGFQKGTLMSRLGLGKFSSIKNPITDTVTRQFTKNALGKFITSPAGIITAASALPFFMGGKEEEEEAELSPYVTEGLDIADIRSRPRFYQDQAYRLMAEGGDTEDAKEPVAKKVMPLIDMDGKEKDYRETGGFVDMGRMEKADDVPARLSKNEFVFTADAVRNAGDGSVDKGAEVMYNMMKNLEAGGEVSEESQGLEGARRMFKTSQRLEEVL